MLKPSYITMHVCYVTLTYLHWPPLWTRMDPLKHLHLLYGDVKGRV
jgi:hypothetical protein